MNAVSVWRAAARRSRPVGYKRMLQWETDAKTSKGIQLGYLTAIMYLAPHKLSEILNVCSNASEGCIKACLFTAGRAAFSPAIRAARKAKTVFMAQNWVPFLLSVAFDIDTMRRQAIARGLKPVVRINGTSDLPKVARFFAQLFPDVQFYDYTKVPQPWKRTLPNYHLTFSHSETNLSHCLDALKHGINVAVVFGIKKGQPLPETWNGYKVISGDNHDLRFLDESGVVVGLYAKGQAKRDCSGFVVRPELIQIGSVKVA
jgi:hypothetical protein